MRIRKPIPEDLERLSALWQEGFGDTAEDVEAFYATAFCCEKALLAEEQNPVACIYWMDAQIGGQKVAYLYALAVEKTCRSRGVGKALLQKTVQALKGEGYKAAILVPGEESLYSYYEKAGFVSFGKTQKSVIEKEAPGLPACKLSAEAYLALRQKANLAVQWGEEAVSYLGSFCDFYAGEDWLLALGREGVQEFTGNPEILPHILYTLNIDKTSCLLPGKNPCAVAYCFAPISLPDAFSPSF